MGEYLCTRIFSPVWVFSRVTLKMDGRYGWKDVGTYRQIFQLKYYIRLEASKNVLLAYVAPGAKVASTLQTIEVQSKLKIQKDPVFAQ